MREKRPNCCFLGKYTLPILIPKNEYLITQKDFY